MNTHKSGSRRSRVQRFDVWYMEKGARGDPCTYCGQVSDTYDHVPPLAMAEAASNVGINCDGPFVKVPACHECNSLLGSIQKLSIRDRRHHLKETLRRKYKHFLRIPNWDEDELAELDERFANEIRQSVKFANALRQRLAWR